MRRTNSNSNLTATAIPARVRGSEVGAERKYLLCSVVVTLTHVLLCIIVILFFSLKDAFRRRHDLREPRSSLTTAQTRVNAGHDLLRLCWLPTRPLPPGPC